MDKSNLEISMIDELASVLCDQHYITYPHGDWKISIFIPFLAFCVIHISLLSNWVSSDEMRSPDDS